MTNFTIVNKDKRGCTTIKADSVTFIDHMRAYEMYGSDEEILDNEGYSNYDEIMVFYLKDGSTKVFSTACQIICG